MSTVLLAAWIYICAHYIERQSKPQVWRLILYLARWMMNNMKPVYDVTSTMARLEIFLRTASKNIKMDGLMHGWMDGCGYVMSAPQKNHHSWKQCELNNNRILVMYLFAELGGLPSDPKAGISMCGVRIHWNPIPSSFDVDGRRMPTNRKTI